MFKLNFLFIFAILGITILGGCMKKNNQPAIYASWGIALNPDNSSPGFILDWGFPRKIKVNNINNLPNINAIKDSVRFFMYYSFVNPSVDSTQINVNNMTSILTKKLQFYNGATSVPDTFGTDPLYNVSTFQNAPFFAQNYLTIPFSYYSSPNKIHYISLVYNANNNLWNNSLDTMMVEFRHNANGDDGISRSGNNWVAFNLNGLRPIGSPDSFKIRIAYTSLSPLGKVSDTLIVPAKWQ